jgi:hypothetical protein
MNRSRPIFGETYKLPNLHAVTMTKSRTVSATRSND